MSGHIYILTDGKNTKIGITIDFDKRMASYRTHNATAQLFRHYPCDIEEAKRVEALIKAVFKDKLAGQGREWFSVGAEVVDRYVATLLEKATTTSITPSMHGVALTDKADHLKSEITKLVEQGKKTQDKKEEFAELFATAFGLGIPKHKLPESVLLRNYDSLDMAHCLLPSESRHVREALRLNRIVSPNDSHAWWFFHLVKLATGHFVALCTAKVSMPYLEAISSPESIREMVDLAAEVGWRCTLHNEWSWHYPDKTALVLYEPKTPVATKIREFDDSFRKWVIERQEMLKLERYKEPESLVMAIEDIVRDNTFPLDVKSYAELCNSYLTPFRGIYDGEEYFAKDAYEFLFSKWGSP